MALSDVPDSTQVDSEGHKIVFENEHIRVLEVRSHTGQSIPMHTHPPRLVVAINGYRLRSVTQDGVESIVDRRSGETKWVEYETHEAEILIGPTHVIEVEIKSAL